MLSPSPRKCTAKQHRGAGPHRRRHPKLPQHLCRRWRAAARGNRRVRPRSVPQQPARGPVGSAVTLKRSKSAAPSDDSGLICGRGAFPERRVYGAWLESAFLGGAVPGAFLSCNYPWTTYLLNDLPIVYGEMLLGHHFVVMSIHVFVESVFQPWPVESPCCRRERGAQGSGE